MSRRWPLLLTAVAAVVWVRAALGTGRPLDYRLDAAPGIDALARLDVAAFLHSGALMGPLSLVLRAPFAAPAGGDQLWAYRLGALPCVLSMAVLLYVLLRRMQRGGHPAAAGLLIAALFALDPLVGRALTWGHPEEILGAVLCALAVLAAADGAPARAAVALGLALATKQWAIVAILPVLLAAPAHRRAIAVGAGALAAALTAPFVLASASAVVHTTQAMASVQSWVAPPNVWWPLAGRSSHQVFDGVATVSVYDYALPSSLNHVPHPLIVVVGLALGALLWRRRPTVTADQALGLLALVMLVRCALDPWNNVYYHVPFVLALLARDAVARPSRPLLSGAGLGFVWLVFVRVWPAVHGQPDLVFGLYVAGAAALAAALAMTVFAPGWTLRRAPRPEPALAGQALG